MYLFRLGMVHRKLGNKIEAVAHLDEAKEVLVITHGKDSAIVKTISEAKEEMSARTK